MACEGVVLRMAREGTEKYLTKISTDLPRSCYILACSAAAREGIRAVTGGVSVL